MENLISPQLDIPISELENIFFNAYSKESSGDPIGRKEYGIRDWYQCGSSAFVFAAIVDNSKIMRQKVGVIDPSKELRDCFTRNETKKRTLKHYKTILSDGQQIDFTKNQLNYWGELAFGDETIVDLPVKEVANFIQDYGSEFLQRCEILKANVIKEMSYVFCCPPKDIEEYLKTQKFTLLV